MKKHTGRKRTLTVHILTIFPDAVRPYFGESLFKRARAQGSVRVEAHDIRAYAKDKHRKVDDTPYGGGPGMVMRFAPIQGAVDALRAARGRRKGKVRVILLSTRGTKLDEQEAQRLAKYDELILICGRYEGVDERVASALADEEISVGDFVLSGGELAAMVLTDAVARKIPGFLGTHESLEEIKGSYPVYTRPPQIAYRGQALKVPSELMGGDHKAIASWRKKFGNA